MGEHWTGRQLEIRASDQRRVVARDAPWPAPRPNVLRPTRVLCYMIRPTDTCTVNRKRFRFGEVRYSHSNNGDDLLSTLFYEKKRTVPYKYSTCLIHRAG